MVNLDQDVDRAFDYVVKRLPTSITYSRFEKTVYVPGSGYVPTYWETPTFDAVASGVSQSEIDSSGGRLEIDDRSFSFRVSEFTSQDDDDPVKPQAGDKIADGDDDYQVDLGDKKTLYRKDATKTLWIVYGRKL